MLQVNFDPRGTLIYNVLAEPFLSTVDVNVETLEKFKELFDIRGNEFRDSFLKMLLNDCLTIQNKGNNKTLVNFAKLLNIASENN